MFSKTEKDASFEDILFVEHIVNFNFSTTLLFLQQKNGKIYLFLFDP